MLIVTIHVDATSGQALGIKESIAQDLEKYGDVRVVAVEEKQLDKCKECWYCEFALVREEAEAALKKRE